MSATVPGREPTRVFNGDTVKWSRSFADYPATTWDLKYRLIGETNQAITAAADGDGYLVTVSNTDSFVWLPGRYRLIGYVEKQDTTERYKVYEDDLLVMFDPATVADGHETRTFWRQVKDDLEVLMVEKAGQSMVSYGLPGRSATRHDWASIEAIYSTAAARVQQEDAEDRARRGESVNNTVGIRFGRP